MVSGTSGGPQVAACTLEFDTDLLGGDIQSGNGALWVCGFVVAWEDGAVCP